MVDVSLESSQGLDLVKDLKLRHPEVAVLMLSTHDETLYAERALRAGAKGYVMKREPMPKVLEAIRKLAKGGLAFSEATMARLVNRFASRPGQQTLPSIASAIVNSRSWSSSGAAATPARLPNRSTSA